MRIVTVSSGATTTHALISGTDGSRYQGAAGVATFTASARRGHPRPTTIAPPTAAVVMKNWRRSMPAFSTPAVIASEIVFGVIVSPLARLRLGPSSLGDALRLARQYLIALAPRGRRRLE